MSKDSRRVTRGGMPPSDRTLLLMMPFSWARLVMASAARRMTLAATLGGGDRGAYCRSRLTRPGRAPASAMRC